MEYVHKFLRYFFHEYLLLVSQSLHNCLFSDLKKNLALVAHDCNPSYSGSRDNEDNILRPAWANTLRDPISKNTQHKAGLAG
jgi:hypothetical protein